MSPKFSRRTVVGAIAGGLAIPTGLSAADSHGFSPDVDLNCFYAEVRSDVRYDRVTVYTEDGSEHEFTGDFGRAERFGYFDATEYQLDGWYGLVDRVEVTKGSQTVTADDRGECPAFEVTCSTVGTDRRPDDLLMYFDHAIKRYDPPVGDRPVYGSPGRRMRRLVDFADEMGIVFRDGCEPESDPGVVFDCTSVTVTPEEFVNGERRFYNVVLTFADGSTEHVGGRETEYEPPETFEGTGDNTGKIVSEITFWNEPSGDVSFWYENPDLSDCDGGDSAAEDPDEPSTDDEGETNDGGDGAPSTDDTNVQGAGGSSENAGQARERSDGSSGDDAPGSAGGDTGENGGNGGAGPGGSDGDGGDTEPDAESRTELAVEQDGFGSIAATSAIGGGIAYLATVVRNAPPNE